MTDKQEQILDIALKLFAEQGYESTPTSRIAKAAGVSEGLIFRHFTNKEGLLAAVMEVGLEKIKLFIQPVLEEKLPRQVIQQVIALPLHIIRKEREFWSLQHTLKVQNQKYAQVFKQSQYLEPLALAVSRAFTELQYEHPQRETEYLFLILNGLTDFLLASPDLEQGEVLLQFIKEKYKN
jgi:AcrR family transcriptional regulator